MLIEPQLDLFSEIERKKVLLDRFIVELEKHLSDLKYTYNQTLNGYITEEASAEARKYLREAQIEVCRLMVVLGIKNEVYKERNFIWYWNNYIETYSSWTRNPLSQQELYEMAYYLSNRFVMTFAKYREVLQPFLMESVKGIETNLKAARAVLK